MTNETTMTSKNNLSKYTILSIITVVLIAIVVFQSFELNRLKGFSQGVLQIQSVSAAGVLTQSATPAAVASRWLLTTKTKTWQLIKYS